MKHVITVIYFTDNAGKARTIEFSLKSFISLAVGFFILMSVLIAAAAFSFKLYAEKNKLLNTLAAVNAEKASAEEKIKEIEAKISKSKDLANPASDLIANPQTKEKNADHQIKDGVNPVALHDFQVKKDNSGLKIGFDLVNVNNGIGLNGYVFIVGDYEGAYFCFPQGIEIKDGVPVDFKKGDRFSIKWQKRIEQTFPFSINKIIKEINVFVFSADGNLLVKKEAAL